MPPKGDKKKSSKPEGKPASKPVIQDNEQIVSEIAFVLVLLLVLQNLLNKFSSGAFFDRILAYLADFFAPVLAFLSFTSTVLSLIFLTGIVYCFIRITEVMNAERKKFYIVETPGTIETPRANLKWKRVEEHVSSENPSDWRLAILEADIMLAEILERMGYQGETIGDKLKSVEKSDFITIDNAWEAHKVRNLIAHEGSDFLITQREAKRIVSLYKRVFEEFRYI